MSAVDYDPFAGPALAQTAPVTQPQRELWAATRMGPDASCAFNESNLLRMAGPLHVDALRGAFADLVDRHEALHSTFSADGESILVLRSMAFELPLQDFAALSTSDSQSQMADVLAREVEQPFDLEQGPLIRARLLRLAPQEHVLVFTAHHLICDGWSTGVLLRDLGALYSARVAHTTARLPPAFPFSAYAHERLEAEQTPEYAAAEAWWLSKFAAPLPFLDLPLDARRPALKTYPSERVDSALGPELVARLKRLAVASGASFFNVLLAGFEVLLHRLSESEDIVVGIPWAGQPVSGHPELVGHCVSTIPIRCHVAADTAFGTLVGDVRSAILDASERSDYTYGRLVSKLAIPRDPSRLPLLSVLFNLDQAITSADLAFDDLSVSFASNPRHFENFDVFINAVEDAGDVRLECQYNTDLLETTTVRRWLNLLAEVLRSAAASPDAPIGMLSLLPASERATLAAWNDTASEYPRSALTHELVEQQVDLTPAAVAVVFETEHVSYAELDRRANQLARRLRELGVDRDARVGLCLERSAQMLVALLAVSKAGGAYVPLDPAYPRDRLEFMVRDSGMAVLVTQESVRRLVPAGLARVLSIDGDDDQASIRAESDARLERPANRASSDIAYVIYTSGSTGVPKGVLVPHRSVVNLLTCTPRTPGLAVDDVVVAITTLSFDIAVFELWLPLTLGARVVVAPREAAGNAALLLGLLHRVQATVLQATPATWRLLIDAGWSGGDGLKVISTGEALPLALGRELVQRSDDVWNLYGPTETTVWSSYYRLPRDLEAVLIGRPLANTQLHVLDRQLQMVPIGVPGELYIGGDGVSRGYLDRSDLTTLRFIEDPFLGESGSRLYRTGDLVRWRPEGTLEYLGRNDHQVKVRGFRIELGEIEAVLARHPSVAQAVAVAREDRPDDVRLVAYVVLRAGAAWVEDDLRELLRSAVPEYMVPQHLVHLQALPVTPNGKIDRELLPGPDPGVAAELEYVAPRNETEQFLAEIWQDILGIGRIGVHDDFFKLGGHSLLAAKVMSRLARDHGISVPLRTLFEAPTIAGFGPRLDGTRAAIRIPRRTSLAPAPASIMQQRITLLEQIGSGARTFNLPAAWRLRGDLDVTALRSAINAFVQHQPATRTTLRWSGSSVVQEVAPRLELALNVVDLRSTPAAERESHLMRTLLAATDEPFDLAQGPLIRVQLFRVDDAQHVLFLLVHHAIWDGWSFDIFVREVDAAYRAYRRGETVQLAELSIEYTDFAAWHNEWLQSAEVAEQVGYWHNQLAGEVPPLEMPTDRPRPRVLSDAGATEWVVISRAQTDALTTLGRREGVTLFVVLLAAFETLLHRYSGQSDLLVGTPIRGRSQPELDDVVGFFVNTVVLRADFGGNPTFREFLQRTRTTVLDALSHQDVPFEFLHMSRNPTYRAFFSFQDTRNRPLAFGDVSLDQLHVLPEAAANDVSLWIMETDSGLLGGLNYSTDLFDRATIQRCLSSFRILLGSIVEDAAARVSSVRLRSASEGTDVGLESEQAISPALVHAAFEAHVDRQPGAPAVIQGDTWLSYAEVDARANAIAYRLRAVGVESRARVILAASGLERMVGLLGIAKAGGAAVPVDPTQPEAWLARIVATAGAAVVLAETTLADALPGDGATLMLFDGATHPDRLTASASVEDIALVAYTVGADAEPVAVELSHAAISSVLQAVVASTALSPSDRYVAVGASASGRSFLETYLPLEAGAALVASEGDLASDGRLLRDALARSGATALHADVHSWRLLVDSGWKGGDGFLGLSSGEPIPLAVADAIRARVGRGFSLYGQAETGFWCGLAPLDSNMHHHGAYASLGAPLGGARWSVVDTDSQPVPCGVAGELRVGGVTLARPYAGSLFATGDRVRLRENNGYEFLGRADNRFGMRGLRVVPSVVEQALEQHPAVRSAAVALADDNGDTRLFAWIVTEPGVDYTDSELRRWARKRLPDALVPRRYVEMDALPLGNDGRVDRSRLPRPRALNVGRGSVAPRTDSEQLLAEIWQEALGLQAVSISDNFFDLGGHSLLCLQVVARLEHRSGVHLSPRLLLLNNLEQVAAQLAGAVAAGHAPDKR